MIKRQAAAILALATAAVFARPLAAQTTPPSLAPIPQPATLNWAAPTTENRLWTRWWWMGNAVDAKNITGQLEMFHAAGLGGVEICPIYGVYGQENHYVDFLSPKWAALLAHTVRESRRLGMVTDMTTGTGWPFGGSTVTDDDASKGIVLKSFDGMPENAPADLPKGKIIGAVCYSQTGVTIENVSDFEGQQKGIYSHLPARGHWVVAVQTGPQQKVKRPAPGAEGNVLDPYTLVGLNKYLANFDTALAANGTDQPRAQFHDSFEYYAATWTPAFFDEFQKRRGYDLHTQLAAMNNEGPADLVARVKCDYRETLSDLHLEYMNRWVSWAHEHGEFGRNQAHGGPGNILDVYANADIPECEMFHVYEEGHMPMLKLASSAAHLTGRRLASSESFTWLDEHFNATLAEVKPCADFLFLNGINHLFLHGIPYSPEDAAWPGWNFYASVNFGPYGGLWHDFPAFTAYVARCQSILQANKPYNDVLLYVPWHEFWSDPAANDKLMVQFTTPGTWMKPYSYYDTAMALQNAGFQYDETSDALLQKATVRADGRILLGGNAYRTLVIPPMHSIPVETLRELHTLAEQGATITFQDAIPTDVPGLNDLNSRRDQIRALTPALAPTVLTTENGDKLLVSAATVGKGKFVVAGIDAIKHLDGAEPMYKSGLRCVRRLRDDGVDYFVANPSSKTVAFVPLAFRAQSAIVMDPRFENRIGTANILPRKEAESGPGGDTITLHLAPGESYFIRTFNDRTTSGPAWQDMVPVGNPMPLAGTWNVSFTDGGPVTPKPFTVTADAAGKLPSWTIADADPEAKRFAGTAKYSLEFAAPTSATAKGYRLDLGKIGDSARVTLNGTSLGTVWAAPFSIDLGAALKPGTNKLEIEVTNVAANRVRDMDARSTQWKIFRDANVLSTAYTVYDATKWPVRDSGLLGPLQLVPLIPAH